MEDCEVGVPTEVVKPEGKGGVETLASAVARTWLWRRVTKSCEGRPKSKLAPIGEFDLVSRGGAMSCLCKVEGIDPGWMRLGGM